MCLGAKKETLMETANQKQFHFLENSRFAFCPFNWFIQKVNKTGNRASPQRHVWRWVTVVTPRLRKITRETHMMTAIEQIFVSMQSTTIQGQRTGVKTVQLQTCTGTKHKSSNFKTNQAVEKIKAQFEQWSQGLTACRNAFHENFIWIS